MLEFEGNPLYTLQDKPAEIRVEQGRVRFLTAGLLIDGNGGDPVKDR